MRKSVFIAGVGSGIGRAATQVFASRGHGVFATHPRRPTGPPSRRIENVHPLRMDVTDAADLDRRLQAD
jgi:NAD(P)-dependent dehydrogenase (short-subunit alcohol dehydrogenase family)